VDERLGLVAHLLALLFGDLARIARAGQALAEVLEGRLLGDGVDIDRNDTPAQQLVWNVCRQRDIRMSPVDKQQACAKAYRW
jgi:hypothetical protein